MKTVLVTGATGFVGSHVLEALMEVEEVRPIAAVRDPGRLLPEFDGEVRRGDLRDRSYVDRLLDGVDVVCHCAAWTSAYGHAQASRDYFLEPTLRLLDRAVAAGTPRVVFAGSLHAPHLARRTPSPLRGTADGVWPHMANVARIEAHMAGLAGPRSTMVNLRLGLFVGRRYGLGMLPLLLPRLRTHLVPWVAGGRTTVPLIAGPDIGCAFARAVLAQGLTGYHAVEVVGMETPTMREVMAFLHQAFGYPLPHFGVPFAGAYAFARLMEGVAHLLPGDPFLTRSIVFLLEETGAGNRDAERLLGYRPQVPWQDAIRDQIGEMRECRGPAMTMARPIVPRSSGV